MVAMTVMAMAMAMVAFLLLFLLAVIAQGVCAHCAGDQSADGGELAAAEFMSEEAAL